MTEQEIIQNAPEGWSHYSDDIYIKSDCVDWFWYPEDDAKWVKADTELYTFTDIRSRKDIERIVELEKQLKGCEESYSRYIENTLEQSE